ncbi:hypothetical protein FHQ18_11565 [Deferribacter autotrophicus]|uniref:Uncharacterized protein n=1 Tax=Deferribacter autotrophicus TaxID=500465 RepID=A0A5A8F2S8_9BACT|nr:hypothetical protein [Deferribacter autotrophicus]KAA0257195.1 hypothetical protein FHQ18_11565 [Deferribacter autotrophicus]
MSDVKYRVMTVLSKHIGKHNAISMVELYKHVFSEEPESKVNGTRKIRKVIEMMRREGVPICATQEKDGSGYYLAAAGSELEDYCKRLRRRALKLLAMESKLRKITLPKLIHDISINIDGTEVK